MSDYEEAIETANDVEYGLSASIVTEDHEEAQRFLRESESGIVKMNEKTTGVELHVPFGGYKRSSTDTYREQGDAANRLLYLHQDCLRHLLSPRYRRANFGIGMDSTQNQNWTDFPCDDAGDCSTAFVGWMRPTAPKP